MTYVDTWPRRVASIEDPAQTAEAFQLRPDRVEAFLSWTDGGEQLLINGGQAVLLPGTGTMVERLVGLGDFAVRPALGELYAEPAAGFWQRYELTEAHR